MALRAEGGLTLGPEQTKKIADAYATHGVIGEIRDQRQKKFTAGFQKTTGFWVTMLGWGAIAAATAVGGPVGGLLTASGIASLMWGGPMMLWGEGRDESANRRIRRFPNGLVTS